MSTAQIQAGFPVDSLELSVCPNEEKFEEILKNSHPEWGKAFSLETWIENNKRYASQLEYTNSKHHRRWVVTSRDDPTHTVLCSGGYYERPALLAYKRRKGESSNDGDGSEEETDVFETNSAHIALVYTAEQHRGHGYAGWMMRRIWEYTEQRPDFAFTYLYSDAGDMYVRYGWKRMPANTMDIPVDRPPSLLSNASFFTSISPFTLQSITDDNLVDVMRRDTTILRDEFAQQIEQADVGTTLAALLPDHRSILWHRARSISYLEEYQRRGFYDASRQFGSYGYMLLDSTAMDNNNGAQSTLRYILWSHDIRNEQLILFRFRHGLDKNDERSKQEALVLLAKAVEEARRWKLPKVTLWSPHSAIEAWLGLKSYSRTRYLPCLGLCPHPDTPESKRAPSEKIEWVLNEFYAY